VSSPHGRMIRILIVDDNAHVRNALRLCLELNSSWQVCGEAENGEDAVTMAGHLNPDVVLLDYAMPGMNGVEAARLISRGPHHCVLILFTMFASQHLLGLAHAAGISEVISKDVGGVRAIVHAIERFSGEAA
jgi:DNA-binding NarL/FixJ family response regulator